jgi:DNA-binding NarL/FixJ family response regulator
LSIKLKALVIKVAIIEDKREIREGLALLIGATNGFRAAGTWRSMEEALPAIGAGVPDIVLVDLELPGMSGIEGIRVLRDRHPNLLLLVLTVFDDDDRIFQAVCAGACGYLLKRTPPARLLEAIREAVEGGSPMSPAVARRVLQLFRQYRPPAKSDHELTPHQVRLLKLFVDGHNYKSAAAALGVSVNTIGFHVQQIYSKLQVHSKSEAVAKALRAGIVSL